MNTRSFRSDGGVTFYSGRQFLFSYKIVNRVFDNSLVDESEILVRKLPLSFSLVEVGPPNNDCTAFVGRFDSYV